jgi:hypothetical protein
MLTIATMPVSGLRLSCMALTEPLEAAVVVTDHSTVPVVPKRLSLPSRARSAAPGAFQGRVGLVLGPQRRAPPIRNSASMQARIARL